MNTPALAGGLTTAVVVRSLINGSGSPGGGAILRDREPVAYWSVIAFGGAIAGFLLYVALTG